MTINGIGGAGVNGVMGMGLPSTAGLTPEGLMIYLQSRLQGLDSQVNSIFQKQQNDQKVQEAIHDLQTALSDAEGQSKNGDAATAIRNALQELQKANPKLAAKVQSDLSQTGQVLEGSGFDAEKYVEQQVNETKDRLPPFVPRDLEKKILAAAKQKAIADAPKAAQKAAEKAAKGKFTKDEIEKSSQYLDNVSKDLESSAQMNMIHLQSLMSNRQTAVQLSTNLIQSLSHSADAIAANTGK